MRSTRTSSKTYRLRRTLASTDVARVDRISTPWHKSRPRRRSIEGLLLAGGHFLHPATDIDTCFTVFPPPSMVREHRTRASYQEGIMDDARFDTLIRSFGMTYSRRGFSRLLGGVTAGGLLTALEATEAAGSRPGGAPCKRGRQCLTRQCVGPKGQKQCTCSQKFPFCLEARNPCLEATCDTVSQQCATTNKPDEDSCGDNLNCSGGVCGEEPGCGGAGQLCSLASPGSCCSKSCDPYLASGICHCSEPGMPCHNTDDDQCC
jgi:hypothetical protein